MSSLRTRRLLAIHRYAGLALSLGMAFFASTGLILLYGHELDELLGQSAHVEGGAVTSAHPLADAVAAVQAARPDRKPIFLFRDAAELPGAVVVGMAPPDATDLEAADPIAVELATGRVLEDIDVLGSFSHQVLSLHAELWIGPLGRFVTGFLGLALLLTVVSGAVLYGPMMRRFAYGLVRWGRGRSLVLTDLHRLLGASAFGWLAVVTLTGLLLSAGGLLLQLFAMTELADLAAAQGDAPPVTDLTNLDAVVANAEATADGRQLMVAIFPGTDLSGPAHHSVLMAGEAGLDKQLLTFAVVDARDPTAVDVRDLPTYMQALLLSEPLHFGDYGGWPLRLLWTLFSAVTLFLAVSGPWSFLVRRFRRRRSTGLADATLEPAE